jgi:cytidylate kinase
MKKDMNFVITINRELGSGGRTVGERLAKKLGVEFYDKALIRGLEEKYNLSVEEIEKMRGRKHNWWDDFKRVTGIGEGLIGSSYFIAEMGKEPDVLTTEKVFRAETEILEAIAENESCVIAGRSGFHVFRNHPNHLSIFIQALLPTRIQRVMRKQNMTEEEARKTIAKVDEMRENYVKRYTGKSRYDTRNYNLVISSDEKTEDEIVDQILMYIG